MGSIFRLKGKNWQQNSSIHSWFLRPCFCLPSRCWSFSYGICCTCSRIERKVYSGSIWLQRSWTTLLWKWDRLELGYSNWWDSYSAWLCLKEIWRPHDCNYWSLNGWFNCSKSMPQDWKWDGNHSIRQSRAWIICNRCCRGNRHGCSTLYGGNRQTKTKVILWSKVCSEVRDSNWLSQR